MADTPPVCDFGWQAPAFTLPATDGRTYSLDDISGENGTLVMFICNHCPYVLAVLDKIIRDAKDLQKLGIGVAAICSNDATTHPADSFENMTKMAEDRSFPFPYLHDEDLYEAMKQVAETGQGPQDQVPSMGCSIKWKAA